MVSGMIYNPSTKRFTLSIAINTSDLTHMGTLEFGPQGGKWNGLEIEPGTYEVYGERWTGKQYLTFPQVRRAA